MAFGSGWGGINPIFGGCGGMGPPRPPPRGGLPGFGALLASRLRGRSGTGRSPTGLGFRAMTATPATARRSSIGRMSGLLRLASSPKSGLLNTTCGGIGVIFGDSHWATVSASPFSLVSSSSGAIFTASMCSAVVAASATIASGCCSGVGRILRRAETPPQTSAHATNPTMTATNFSP